MNWKLLGAMAALIGVGASVALGQGTTPTIVQGDYISNVFGQSNFVKNPNAKLNTNDVTVSSATVSRSPTTALVATSEFNVAVTSANGTITWATRSFDAGMKNQNCEARFTYRGFQSTSKAHVKQGANTVATLNLSATGTDPRIASINFPCGDLSQPTTFVVTDTAILAGTNEIGGIYVGLATNQANVAQAEFVGGGEWTASTIFTRPANVTQSSFAAFTSGSAGTALGKATSAGSDTTVTFPSLPAGNYMIVTNFQIYTGNQTQSGECKYSVQEIDSNTFNGQTWNGSVWTTGTIFPGGGSSNQAYFNFTTTSQRRFRIVTTNTASGASSFCGAAVDTTSNKAGIYVYRFPTSSELVVKPETQNTWAGITSDATSGSSSTSSTSYTQVSGFGNYTTLGKATSTGSMQFTVPTIPVGSYKFDFQFLAEATPSGTGDRTDCVFSIYDGSTDRTAAYITSKQEVTSAGTPVQGGVIGSVVIQYTSVQSNKQFTVRVKRNGGTGTCNWFGSNIYASYFTMTPLDQPSNSALYVQGPVLGAQTGAAISAGYVGETQEISGTSTYSVTSPALNTWYAPWTSTLTLNPGTWSVCFSAVNQVEQTASGTTDTANRTRVQNTTDSTTLIDQISLMTYSNAVNRTGQVVTHSGCKTVSITAAKTYRVEIQAYSWSGSPTLGYLALRCFASPCTLHATRLN